MTRTTKSTSTLIVDEAVLLGHEIEFTYQIPQGETKPTSVTATAKLLPVNGMPAYPMPHEVVTVKASAEGISVQSQQEKDKGLIDEISEECLLIINGTEGAE